MSFLLRLRSIFRKKPEYKFEKNYKKIDYSIGSKCRFVYNRLDVVGILSGISLKNDGRLFISIELDNEVIITTPVEYLIIDEMKQGDENE